MPTILLVEDDKDLQFLLSKKLEQEGFTVMQALTGTQALEMITQGPDLVLMDILLPDIDGISILHEIATHVATKNLPVIILSNMADQGYMDQASQVGRYEYLVKSKVDFNTVIKKIKEVLKLD